MWWNKTARIMVEIQKTEKEKWPGSHYPLQGEASNGLKTIHYALSLEDSTIPE